MTSEPDAITRAAERDYQYGFVTAIEQETTPPGINEDVVRFISAKKEEPPYMLEWRLRAYRRWLEMAEPNWAFVKYPPIDYLILAP
jgi:Fe-S cluster assembly protein SufB